MHLILRLLASLVGAGVWLSALRTGTLTSRFHGCLEMLNSPEFQKVGFWCPADVLWTSAFYWLALTAILWLFSLVMVSLASVPQNRPANLRFIRYGMVALLAFGFALETTASGLLP